MDEVSNFRNRILTIQKPKLVIRNCQWNCILVPDLHTENETETFVLGFSIVYMGFFFSVLILENQKDRT